MIQRVKRITNGSRCRTDAKAETTGYARSARRAFDSQPRGHFGSVVWCPAPQRCAPAARFQQWSARCPFRLNIQHKHANSQTRRHQLRVYKSGQSRRLRDAQTLKRGASRSSTDVRDYEQFKNGDIRKFNVIFLDLACSVRWAEIPLLTHNFSKRVSAIRRPSQAKLLGTRCRGFFGNERDCV